MPNARPSLAAIGLLGATALLATGCGADSTDVAAPSGSGPAAAAPSAGPTPVISTPVGSGASSAPGATPGSAATRPAATEPVATADARMSGSTRGVFRAYQSGATAVTYDPAVVPAGSAATVVTRATGGGTKVQLTVTGMVPRRAYGAHLHTEPCARTPQQAGPHYQHTPDPRAIASPPSVDPRYANPRNEVWLDFTTDASGKATVKAAVKWPFDSVNPPRSLVVHAERTRTAAGQAGTAGARAACLTLPL